MESHRGEVDAAAIPVSGSCLAPSPGMTSPPTKDSRSDIKSDPANDPPISKTQPGMAVPPASSEPDLESRIRVRRAELLAKLGELKTDKRLEATEVRDVLKAKLSELAHLLKWGSTADGWSSLGDNVKHRLERWLADSSRQIPAHEAAAKSGQS